MSGTADDFVFDILGQGRALPGVSARQIVEVGARALAAQSWSILDVHAVAARIQSALRSRRPLSLIRLGDGESLTLAQGLVLAPDQVLARGPFLPAAGVPVPSAQTRDALLWAVRHADLLGVPLSRADNYQPLCAAALAAAGVVPDPARLTHSLVNYELWKHGRMPGLLAGAAVLVVGGPGEAFAETLRRHGVHVAGVVAPFLGVGHVEATLEACHRHRYDIALVSAGIGACMLCPRLSAEMGVVAIDFGAMADEAVRGERWWAESAADGPLTEAGVRRVCAAAGGEPDGLIQRRVERIWGSPDAGVFRYRLWQEEPHGSVRDSSFVVKVRPGGDGLEWEARVLGWVRQTGGFTVPAALAAGPGWLALEDLGGSSVEGYPQLFWLEAVATLARFHTRSHLLPPVLPPVRRWQWAPHRERASGALAEAEAHAAARPVGLMTHLDTLRAAVDALRGDGPGDTECALVHGDFRAANVLVPDRPGRALGLVDWEDAAEQPPAWDVARLAGRLPPAERNLIAHAYLRARADNGWPCAATAFLHDFTLLAQADLVIDLASTLQEEALHGGTADRADHLALALENFRRHPAE